MSSSHAPVAPTPSPEPSPSPSPSPQAITSSQPATPILVAPTRPTTRSETPQLTYLPQLVVLGATIFGGVLAFILPDDASNSFPSLLFTIPGGMLVLVSVYSFVAQWHALRASRPMLLRLEGVLLAAAAVLPAIALLLGDLNGAAAFNNEPTLTLSQVLITAAVCALFAVTLLASANAVYIVTRFHKAAKILGIVAYGVTWVAVALVAYAIYGFQYSSHDPNSE